MRDEDYYVDLDAQRAAQQDARKAHWMADLCEREADRMKQVGVVDDETLRTTFAPIEDIAAPATNKRTVLEAAIKTVADRGAPYGGVEDNFGRIAALWRVHMKNRYGLDTEIDASDVASMMILMKLARLENQPRHPDSWIDIAGYAACGGEITA